MADNLLVNVGLFALSFYILIKAASFFVSSASTLGKRLGMSKLMIGLTIVAIGTSLPELVTSWGAMLFTPNFSQFIIGTIMGSSITNILLVFGIFLLIAGDFQTKRNYFFSIISLIVTTTALILFVLFGFLNWTALFLLGFYFFYIYYVSKREKDKDEEEDALPEKGSTFIHVIILALSFIGLFIGVKLIVFSIENIGLIFSIPTAYLSLTALAIATSLPEAIVTVTSIRKNEHTIGIGNIIGSNIMNVGITIGGAGFFGYFAINTSLYIYSAIFLLLATVIFSYLLLKRKFHRAWGILLLVLYVIYLGTFFFG